MKDTPMISGVQCVSGNRRKRQSKVTTVLKPLAIKTFIVQNSTLN